MKQYLEVCETQEPGLDINPPELIRIYVESEQESRDVLKIVKKTMKMTKYTAKHVNCRHEEGQSCDSVLLEQVEYQVHIC